MSQILVCSPRGTIKILECFLCVLLPSLYITSVSHPFVFFFTSLTTRLIHNIIFSLFPFRFVSGMVENNFKQKQIGFHYHLLVLKYLEDTAVLYPPQYFYSWTMVSKVGLLSSFLISRALTHPLLSAQSLNLLAKLTSRNPSIQAEAVDTTYPTNANVLHKAGLAPPVFPTMGELWEK